MQGGAGFGVSGLGHGRSPPPLFAGFREEVIKQASTKLLDGVSGLLAFTDIRICGIALPLRGSVQGASAGFCWGTRSAHDPLQQLHRLTREASKIMA